MRYPFRLCLLLVLMHAAACAQLKVSKVPLSERLHGDDYKHHGFRYYLSRPYVVVSERVEVAHNYSLGAVVPIAQMNENGEAIGMAVGVEAIRPDPQTKRRPLFDMDGKPLPLNAPGQAGWAPLSLGGVRQAAFQDGGLTPDQSKEVDKKIRDATQVLTENQQKQVGQLVDGKLLSLGAGKIGTAPVTVNVSSAAVAASTPNQPKPDAFQVVFLPDFEQQMAIKDCNFLAYSKYELNFADGWQLSAAKGSFDSTEVPVRILQSITNALDVAANISKKALTTLPITEQELKDAAKDRSKDIGKAVALVLLTRTEYIPPGMYRLQKPSEMTCDAKAGAGFLTELGFPTESDFKVQLIEGYIKAK